MEKRLDEKKKGEEEDDICQSIKNKTKKRSRSSNSFSSSNSNESSSSSSESSNKMKYKSKRLKTYKAPRSRSRSYKKKYSRKRSHEAGINTKLNNNSSSSESSYKNKRKRYESGEDEESNRDKYKKKRHSHHERKNNTRNSNRDLESRRYKQNEFYTASEDEKYEHKVRNKREDKMTLNRREDKSKLDDKNKEIKPPIIKEKPNFNATGILAKETNTLNGVILKFTEPLDSAEPTEEWRLYSFKESDEQVLHPSCSRQHAVIQYRKTEGVIKPYILDLESTNGTFIDKEKIDPARYYELRNYDLINFGMSSRDYILIKGDSIDYSKLKK